MAEDHTSFDIIFAGVIVWLVFKESFQCILILSDKFLLRIFDGPKLFLYVNCKYLTRHYNMTFTVSIIFLLLLFLFLFCGRVCVRVWLCVCVRACVRACAVQVRT